MCGVGKSLSSALLQMIGRARDDKSRSALRHSLCHVAKIHGVMSEEPERLAVGVSHLDRTQDQRFKH